MRRALPWAAGVAGVLALAACSSSRTDFTTEGLIVPTGQCTVDPRSVGQAEKIDDIDEGNGCQVHHAWKLYSLGDVRLSRPATLNCGMVGELGNWMNDIVQP